MKYLTAIILCLAGITALPVSAEVRTMSQVAVASERPAGAPDYDDVCLRYGWVRKGAFPTVEDAKQAIQDFHATRVDWFYPGSHTADPGATYVTKEAKAFIDWCHARDMKVGGAINNNTTHQEWGVRKTHSGRFNGEPNNPEFVSAVNAWGKAQIDAGIDTLVCDDMFHYNANQRKQFRDKCISEIKKQKPGYAIAGNDGSSWATTYVKSYAFDFHYSDSNFLKFKPTPGRWWAASKDHRKEGSVFLIHPNRPMTKEMRRQAISLGYASGAHVIAPWDEWISGAPRLFADPADFSDLYGFARALGQLGYLKGYEDAAVGGHELKENRYGKVGPIAVSGGSGKLSVFGRAKPGDSLAPIVFHLLESGNAKAATLRLQSAALFSSGKLKATLLTPSAYGQAAHRRASASGDYQALAKSQSLKLKQEGGSLIAKLPPVSPWCVLIITPIE